MEAGGLLDAYSKKQGATLRREMRKISRNLGGIRKLTRLPGAMVVIDQKREIIAVREANKLGIPVVCLLDTECDPDLVDIPIPGNDDAMRAIEIIVKELADSIAEGMQMQSKAGEEPEAPGPRRRSRRQTTARAESAADKEGTEAAPSEAAPPADKAHTRAGSPAPAADPQKPLGGSDSPTATDLGQT